MVVDNSRISPLPTPIIITINGMPPIFPALLWSSSLIGKCENFFRLGLVSIKMDGASILVSNRVMTEFQYDMAIEQQ